MLVRSKRAATALFPTRARISMAAASELVVRSGHNVCENRDAQREVIRILRLELQRERAVARR